MLHLYFTGIRATLCIFPISHLQKTLAGSAASPLPRALASPANSCCWLVLRCAGLSQWFKLSYLRMWWISSACSLPVRSWWISQGPAPAQRSAWCRNPRVRLPDLCCVGGQARWAGISNLCICAVNLRDACTSMTGARSLMESTYLFFLSEL